MSDDDVMRAQFVRRIATRRSEVARYVRAVRPWSNRLATVSVVSGALVALSTAGPALGSSSFTGAVQETLGLSSDLGVWRVACLVALAVSLISTVSSAMLRRQDVVARVGAAESAAAELGALSMALEYRQVEIGDAVARFQQLNATVTFVDEADPAPAAPVAAGHPISGPLPQTPPARVVPAQAVPARAVPARGRPAQGTGAWRSYYDA